jgi:hypothetical protein
MKRKKAFTVTSLVILISLFSLQSAVGQSDDPVKRKYETGRFTGLFLEGAYGIELIQGNNPSLEVSVSNAKAFDYIKVTNNNGVLHLHVDRKPFDFSRITLHVTFKDLSYLRIFGSIKLETRGFLDLNDLEMLLEGGAKVSLQAKANHISLDNRGGVLVELQGVAQSLQVRLAGTGHVNAGELRARDVKFRIEGLGTGRVFATENLEATIKGAGKIRYKGDPKVVQDIDGLGSVSRE